MLLLASRLMLSSELHRCAHSSDFRYANTSYGRMYPLQLLEDITGNAESFTSSAVRLEDVSYPGT